MSSALHFKCNMMLGTIWTDALSFVNCWINFPPLGFLPRFLFGAVATASVASVAVAPVVDPVASVAVAPVDVASVAVATVAPVIVSGVSDGSGI
jgi:hypothetical protein